MKNKFKRLKSLRSDAFKAITARANSHGWKEDLKYAYVTSNEWHITMEYGAPKYRRMNCVVVMIHPVTGRCTWEGFTIRQDYNGSGYGGTYCDGNSQRIRAVRCEDSGKYK